MLLCCSIIAAQRKCSGCKCLCTCGTLAEATPMLYTYSALDATMIALAAIMLLRLPAHAWHAVAEAHAFSHARAAPWH